MLAAPAAAQANGGTGGSLLELPATPRQVAFQGAYTAVVGDEGSVFVNPAGMAAIHRIAIGVSTERNLMGARLSSAAAALRVGRFDLGFGAMILDLSGDSVIVPDPSTGGDQGMATGDVMTAYQAMLVGAAAYRRGMFSIGASTKFLNEHVGVPGASPAPVATSGITGDIGIAMALFDIMALGYVVQNVTGHLWSGGQPARLPRTSRFGVTLNIVDPQGTERLMFTTDLVGPPGGNSYWAVGIEGGVVPGGVGVLGRLGFSLGRAPSERGGLSAGAELRVRSLRVEYAWQAYGALDAATHRIGIRWAK